MGHDANQPPRDLQTLARRVDELERENDRLRKKVEPLLGPDNPWFDLACFTRVLRRTLLICTVPVYLAFGLLALAMPFASQIVPSHRIGSIPVVDFVGKNTRHPGFARGIVAVGGVSVGVVAVGGLAVGLIAFGGGAVGVLAVGGGSAGIIAIGGGAVGYIALGGGAFGWYAMGGNAYGRHALGINRQDLEAVAFFVRLVPGLRKAVTTPMPVIPLSQDKDPSQDKDHPATRPAQ